MKHKKPPLGKNKERLLLALLSAVLIVTIPTLDYEDEIGQQQHYCKMIKEWNANAHLPKEDRPGWPPYNGEEQCHGD